MKGRGSYQIYGRVSGERRGECALAVKVRVRSRVMRDETPRKYSRVHLSICGSGVPWFNTSVNCIIRSHDSLCVSFVCHVARNDERAIKKRSLFDYRKS